MFSPKPSLFWPYASSMNSHSTQKHTSQTHPQIRPKYIHTQGIVVIEARYLFDSCVENTNVLQGTVTLLMYSHIGIHTHIHIHLNEHQVSQHSMPHVLHGIYIIQIDLMKIEYILLSVDGYLDNFVAKISNK
jgi:hypothetical protein